jgi:S-formylglutathione hydrolase FrmB
MISKIISILCLIVLLGCSSHSKRKSIDQQYFYSPSLGGSKRYSIYLPPSYAISSHHYPVIYLLHGLGASETTWQEMGIGDVADQLKLEAIIVMPDGDRGYYVNSLSPTSYEYCMSESPVKKNKNEQRESFCVSKSDYENYITEDLITYIDRTYRTITKREGRAITGESAGGFGAMHLALRHQDLFSSAASHSGLLSLLYDGPKPFKKGTVGFLTTLVKNQKSPEQLAIFGEHLENWKKYDPTTLVKTLKDQQLALYIDCGQDDEFGFQNHALHFHETLLKHKIPHQFHLPPGKHDEDFWRKRIFFSLKFHIDQFIQMGTYTEFQEK